MSSKWIKKRIRDPTFIMAKPNTPSSGISTPFDQKIQKTFTEREKEKERESDHLEIDEP